MKFKPLCKTLQVVNEDERWVQDRPFGAVLRHHLGLSFSGRYIFQILKIFRWATSLDGL